MKKDLHLWISKQISHKKAEQRDEMKSNFAAKTDILKRKPIWKSEWILQ